jgi:alpha-glucosidase
MRTGSISPAHVRANQAERLAELPPGAWPCNTLGNHDTPRTWSRYGDGTDGVLNNALARLHLALMLTLKGTPFLYYGEEIGMSDLELTALHELRDTMVIQRYHKMTEKLGVSPELALLEALAETRDRCRSPFQWSAEPNGGFSPAGVQTWLPVNPNYQAGINAAAEEADPGSLLNFYRRLLKLRKTTPALMAGEYRCLDVRSPDCLSFLRREVETGQTCLVALNFSRRDQSPSLSPKLRRRQTRLLFSSRERKEEIYSLESLKLAAFEIFIAELTL